jgi:dynein heavy chain 1
LSESVTKLEERVEQLLITCDKVDAAVNLLEKVDYDAVKFRQVMDSIQKYIDEMSLGGFPQLASWVQGLDERLAKVLAIRLCKALENWNDTFRPTLESKDSGEEEQLQKQHHDSAVRVLPISIEILVRNQEISCVPSVPTTRSPPSSSLTPSAATITPTADEAPAPAGTSVLRQTIRPT